MSDGPWRSTGPVAHASGSLGSCPLALGLLRRLDAHGERHVIVDLAAAVGHAPLRAVDLGDAPPATMPEAE